MKDEGRVITVTGVVAPESLGVTLTHEHLFIDLSKYYTPHEDPEVRAELEGPLTPSMLGYVRWFYRWNRDNTFLDDGNAAVEEAGRFVRLGGRTLCDVTSRGIRVEGQAEKLRRVSEALGLHIVMGTGYYVALFHDEFVQKAGIDDLAALFVQEIEDGIGPERVRAGIIGEIGLGVPVKPDEEKVLRAAARAHLWTGAPIVIHQIDIEYRIPHWALDVLEAEGVNPNRVVLGHSGDRGQLEPLIRAMRRGAYVAYDNFALEGYYFGWEAPNPGDYVQRIRRLVDAGFADRLLLSHDVAIKQQLRRYGGAGYDQILRDIRPMLTDAGVGEDAFRVMMVENPARLLPIGR